jgi:serine/threonine-protein kinase
MALSRFAVESSRFANRQPIGSGAYSQAFKATDSTTGATVCVRVLKPGYDSEAQRQYERELETFAENAHPATLCLIGFSATEDGFITITPFAPYGSVANALHQTALGATRKLNIVFGVVAGMAFVHSRGILYRHLKPENILLDDKFEPLIGDFAVYVRLSAAMDFGPAGTPIFMAPETLTDDESDCAVDVYAFAVTLYRLFAESVNLDDDGRPFRTHLQLLMRVISGARFVKAPEIPDALWVVITRCWAQEPAARPTFWALLNEFRGGKGYVLDGADRAAVLDYESRVWGDFGPPKN